MRVGDAVKYEGSLPSINDMVGLVTKVWKAEDDNPRHVMCEVWWSIHDCVGLHFTDELEIIAKCSS